MYEASRNLTEVPLSSVYSGAASLRGIMMVLSISKLSRLKPWRTDTGNACLEAFYNKMFCAVAEPELETLKGHTLTLNKALCRLVVCP